MLASRRLTAALVCAAAFVVILPTVPAAAAGTTTTTTATTGTGTAVYAGWSILGATVTRPGIPPQHWDSKHAAAFMQSWYFATLYGTLTEQKPPAGLPRSTFKAKDTINGGSYTFVGYYVTNGKQGAAKKVWVGLPVQGIGPGAYVPVEKWYIAPPRAILAWEGKVGPVPPGGPTTTLPTTTTKPAAAVPASNSSGSSKGWIVVVGAVAVALVLAALIVARTRRRAASEPPALESR
jgi:hypothetical protein